MEIAAVDQRDIDRGVTESTRGVKTAESSADYHHSVHTGILDEPGPPRIQARSYNIAESIGYLAVAQCHAR